MVPIHLANQNPPHYTRPGSRAIAFTEGSVQMIGLEEVAEAPGIGITILKGSIQWGWYRA
jgi:hypothetical protein